MSDDALTQAHDLNSTLDSVQAKTASLTVSANGFASAMARAFNQSVISGKQFDDVLKSLALRISSLSMTAALKPLASGITGGLGSLFSGLFGTGMPSGAKMFADGGVIGTPTYFPLGAGATGVAGEAGPEAILPLARGSDGRLGVASAGGVGGATNVTIQIATPDAASFRRSQSYITGQIARAVARGQRSL